MKRIAAVLGIVAVTVTLGACSSGSSSGDSSAGGSASAAVLPPVMVDATQTTAVAKVGDTVVFAESNPTQVKISTDAPDLLELTQGRTDGMATFNPGAKALKSGEAKVTITNPDGSTRVVTVTVQ